MAESVNLASPSSPVVIDPPSDCEASESLRPENPVISLRDHLKCPQKSDLARKRKVPPTGKKRSSGYHGAKDPKVEPGKRVKEFPNESLIVSSMGHLFCNACREILSVKRSTLLNHVKFLSMKPVKKS